MSAEGGECFEQRRSDPTARHDPPGERGSERHRTYFSRKLGKQDPQLSPIDAPNVGIARIVHSEVVPEKRATGSQNPNDLPSDALAHGTVENRRENCRGDREPECPVRPWHLSGVAQPEVGAR